VDGSWDGEEQEDGQPLGCAIGRGRFPRAQWQWRRSRLPTLYPVCPLFCLVVSLLLFLSLFLSRYLELSFDVGLDGTASVAVFAPCLWSYQPTGTPTRVVTAVSTWSAVMGAPFDCFHGRSPSRCPSENKTEQHQRVVCMGRQVPVIPMKLAQ